jgi:hypothetical protein
MTWSIVNFYKNDDEAAEVKCDDKNIEVEHSCVDF